MSKTPREKHWLLYPEWFQTTLDFFMRGQGSHGAALQIRGFTGNMAINNRQTFYRWLARLQRAHIEVLQKQPKAVLFQREFLQHFGTEEDPRVSLRAAAKVTCRIIPKDFLPDQEVALLITRNPAYAVGEPRELADQMIVWDISRETHEDFFDKIKIFPPRELSDTAKKFLQERVEKPSFEEIPRAEFTDEAPSSASEKKGPWPDLPVQNDESKVFPEAQAISPSPPIMEPPVSQADIDKFIKGRLQGKRLLRDRKEKKS